MDQFAEHLSTLPDCAEPQVEFDWIRAHPLMLAAAIADGDVVIGMDDIANAPSKAAVSALQHWCKRPEEFHRRMMMGTKKKIVKTEKDIQAEADSLKTNSEKIIQAHVEEVPDDLSQLKRLLEEEQGRSGKKKQAAKRKKKAGKNNAKVASKTS